MRRQKNAGAISAPASVQGELKTVNTTPSSLLGAQVLHFKCSICRRPMLAVVRQAIISESAAATGRRANRGALATGCQSANRRTDARTAGHNCDRFSRRPSAPHFAPLPICPRLRRTIRIPYLLA